jgi:hypothetical protein
VRQLVGNVNREVAEESSLRLSLSAASALADSDAPPPDLQLAYKCELTNDRVLEISGLTITGKAPVLASQEDGLQIFAHIAEALAAMRASSTQQLASQRPAPPAPATIVVHIHVNTLHLVRST